MKNHKKNMTMDSPLSESSVSLKLSLIQKRCGELMDKMDGHELTLEEPESSSSSGDPYNRLT